MKTKTARVWIALMPDRRNGLSACLNDRYAPALGITRKAAILRAGYPDMKKWRNDRRAGLIKLYRGTLVLD